MIKRIAHNRLTYEYVKDFIEKENYVLLSKEYTGNRQKLDLICPKGHNYKTDFHNFKLGHRCPVCADEKCGISERKDYSKVKREYHNRDFPFDIRNLDKRNRHELYKSLLIYTGVEGVDYIECKICGKRGLSLDSRHLKSFHNITKEEYQYRFPNAYITSECRKKLQSRPNNKGRTGYKNSEWHNKRISECQKDENNSFYGKTHSKEVMEKARIKRENTLLEKYNVLNPRQIPNIVPNKLESYFNSITTDDVYFIGNGKMFVTLENGSHKNPDFKIRNQRKFIELFGDYWHKGDDPNLLIHQYKEVGYDCLIFWESEVYNKTNNILKIVNEFIER